MRPVSRELRAHVRHAFAACGKRSTPLDLIAEVYSSQRIRFPSCTMSREFAEHCEIMARTCGWANCEYRRYANVDAQFSS
jgi:hypothetical protein